MSNFIHHQVGLAERKKQTKNSRGLYNKHQNTIDTLDYQAVTHV